MYSLSNVKWMFRRKKIDERETIFEFWRYQSDTIKNIRKGHHIPIEIVLKDKLVIEKDKVDSVDGYNVNKCYIFSIMGVDTGGKLFCVHNNHGGGGNSFLVRKENIETNEFIIDFGFYFSRVELFCEFE